MCPRGHPLLKGSRHDPNRSKRSRRDKHTGTHLDPRAVVPVADGNESRRLSYTWLGPVDDRPCVRTPGGRPVQRTVTTLGPHPQPIPKETGGGVGNRGSGR